VLLVGVLLAALSMAGETLSHRRRESVDYESPRRNTAGLFSSPEDPMNAYYDVTSIAAHSTRRRSR